MLVLMLRRRRKVGLVGILKAGQSMIERMSKGPTEKHAATTSATPMLLLHLVVVQTTRG